MFQAMSRKLATIACATGFIAVLAGPAMAQEFRVEGAGLEAVPTSYSGPCPGLINLQGKIQANGKGRVKYTYFYNDGGSGPEGFVDFEEAGVKHVETTWRLGGASLTHFEGWGAIRILSPNSYESNKAKFVMDCQPGKEKQPEAQPAGDQKGKGTVKTQQPGEISMVVMEGLRWAEKDSAARADARRKAFEADRTRFEPTAKALPEVLKASGVDLDGYLAASRQFVETPPEKMNQGEVDRVNKKFAEPIRTAIAKAVGVPGVGDILQGMQSGQPAPGAPGQGQPNQDNGNSTGGPTAAACCSTNRFEPPFEGMFTEADLGASAIRPGEIRQLDPHVRSAIVSAPHRLERSGRIFTVPATARHVSVTVNLGTNWVIGLSGVGYAHVWLGLDMNVTDARSAVVCGAPHMEQDNQWTWVGGSLTLSDHRPGPSVVRTCVFDRNAGDPTEYSANVSASTDGTFVGFSGGYGDYYVDLGAVDVTTCP